MGMNFITLFSLLLLKNRQTVTEVFKMMQLTKLMPVIVQILNLFQMISPHKWIPSTILNSNSLLLILQAKMILRCCTLINIRSANKKFDPLRLFLESLSFNCSVIGLSETWFSDHSDPSLFSLRHYNLITNNRQGKAGGGVG